MDNKKLSELMLGIKNKRDELAFSTLFDFIAPKLKAYFLQNGILSENAEELTQEVMFVHNVFYRACMIQDIKSLVETQGITYCYKLT